MLMDSTAQHQQQQRSLRRQSIGIVDALRPNIITSHSTIMNPSPIHAAALLDSPQPVPTYEDIVIPPTDKRKSLMFNHDSLLVGIHPSAAEKLKAHMLLERDTSRPPSPSPTPPHFRRSDSDIPTSIPKPPTLRRHVTWSERLVTDEFLAEDWDRKNTEYRKLRARAAAARVAAAAGNASPESGSTDQPQCSDDTTDAAPLKRRQRKVPRRKSFDGEQPLKQKKSHELAPEHEARLKELERELRATPQPLHNTPPSPPPLLKPTPVLPTLTRSNSWSFGSSFKLGKRKDQPKVPASSSPVENTSTNSHPARSSSPTPNVPRRISLRALRNVSPVPDAPAMERTPSKLGLRTFTSSRLAQNS
ncbi:hypothetical protein BJ742DRAFT_780552 [Cladochytrium replicatum]|nr:hypothetical protein BJ742DRAFT_780552 [Cladochytrium replicatum]